MMHWLNYYHPDVCAYLRTRHSCRTATRCNTLQHTATHCNTLQKCCGIAPHLNTLKYQKATTLYMSAGNGYVFKDALLQCVAVCCSVLQCVAVCCSVLQCVAECDVLPAMHVAVVLSSIGIYVCVCWSRFIWMWSFIHEWRPEQGKIFFGKFSFNQKQILKI